MRTCLVLGGLTPLAGLAAIGRPAPAMITSPDYALWSVIIADVWEWFPFTMLMLLAALQMMPSEPFEAARIDGAGPWQTFLYVWLLQMSFKPQQEIFAFPPKLLFVPTVQHYWGLWSTEFRGSFANSAIASVTSTVLSLLIGVPAAYSLARARFRADYQISLWVLASRMAPPIAFTIPFFLVYRYLDLIDTVVGLIIIYLTFNLSLVIWMMRVFFEGVPRSLEEAAWIDGASVWGTFPRIVLPLSAPGLAATAIFCFLFSWNDFFYALILTRTQAMTAPVAVVNFMIYEGWDWGKIAAGGTMVMLPVVAFSLLVRNYLVRGLTAGAVKG